MNFTGKRAPVVAVFILIWLALIGLAVTQSFVLAQTTPDDGSVRVAGITPTPTSPSPTPTTPGVTPAVPAEDVSIPEPTSIALMGLGLAGLAGYLKRRRSQ